MYLLTAVLFGNKEEPKLRSNLNIPLKSIDKPKLRKFIKKINDENFTEVEIFITRNGEEYPEIIYHWNSFDFAINDLDG